MQASDRDHGLSLVLISLMKGVTYMENDPPLWQSLLNLQAKVREYVAVLGLELILDEAEGHAYLRQKPSREGEPELPRLVQRRQLSYPFSLLLALIRKKLAEADAQSGDTRLILEQEEIVDLARNFFADSPNSARLTDRNAGHIGKLVDMGFLRRLHGSEERYEVGRILKSFVDAQWLQEFEARLAGYRSHGVEIACEAKEALLVPSHKIVFNKAGFPPSRSPCGTPTIIRSSWAASTMPACPRA